MSIGVVAMFTNLLLDFALYPKNTKKLIPSFIKQKSLFFLSFIFFTSLLALVYSKNTAVGFQFVLNKLPFLVVPLAFSHVKSISKKQFHFLLAFFVATIFISALFVFFNYIQNYETLNISIKKGQAIWVPFNHIRYSVMLVFAFCAACFLAFSYKNKQLFYFIASVFIAAFLFGLIHLLSVRSGIIALYLSLFIALGFYIYSTKKYYLVFVGLTLIIALPMLAYQFIPSFKNKIAYTKYDWEQFQTKNIGSNSDSRRLISYQAGFSLVKQNMPLGLGTGSLQDFMNLYYAEHYPNMLAQDRIAPHNQFLFTLLDCGVLGFLALLLALFYPVFSLKNKSKHLLYILFWIIAFTPLIYDISLERQLGITYFVLFSSLFLKRILLEAEQD